MLSLSAKAERILIHVNNFVRSTLRSHLCLVIDEFLKAKTPIFSEIDFSRIFKQEEQSRNLNSVPHGPGKNKRQNRNVNLAPFGPSKNRSQKLS